MIENLFIESKNGNKLACLVAKPENPKGLVISSQGFGSTKDKPQYQSLLNGLPKLGFVVVVFEFQGSGESEGDFRQKTESRDLEDLRAVVEYAFNNFEFNKEKFFVFGSSFGGFTALNLALEESRVKGLVLKAPVSNFEEVYVHLREERKYIIDYDAFFEDGKKYDVYSKASQLKIPVKIIHGDKDETVPITQSEKLVSLIPNGELKLISGAKHQFEGHEEESYSEIIKFFKGWLK